MKRHAAIHTLGAWLVTLALGLSAAGQQIFLDDYDTTPTGVTVGSAPPNPPYTSASGATVESGVSVSGANSLRVRDPSGVSASSFRRGFVETNNLPDGRLSFDLRIDSMGPLNSGAGPSISLNAFRPTAFVELPIGILEFFRTGDSTVTNNIFRLQNQTGFPVFTLSFPLGTFQHIEFGWAGANHGTQGLYWVTWNSITNYISPLNPSHNFSTISSLSASDASFTGTGEYEYYIDNLTLSLPEPSALTLGAVAGLVLLARRRRSG